MKLLLQFFSFALAVMSVQAADKKRALELRIRSEVEYALSSGIAGAPYSVNSNRVWVPVTPGLAGIFEQESAAQIIAILERMQKEASDPKQSQLWSYIGMCLMVFPEKEHAEPSTIGFPAGKNEPVVLYGFPLERWLRPGSKKKPTQASEPMGSTSSPPAPGGKSPIAPGGRGAP